MAPPLQQYNSIFKKDSFKGDVALITGGGTGIGRCIAHELAHLGAIVIVAGRKIPALKRTVEEITQRGAKAGWVQMNIRDPEQVRRVVEDIVGKYGPITCLVNNAGGQFLSPAAAITDNGWRTVVDLNLNGTWNVTRAVFDTCMKQHCGRIVCITMDHWNGVPLMTHSGASRAGIENMCKSLAVEWTPVSGVRINCVAPGSLVGSGMLNYSTSVVEQMAYEVSWQNPSGRLGSESEISAAACFLLSPAASYINGTTVKADGGSSLLKGVSFGLDPEKYFKKEGSVPVYIGLPDDVETELPPVMKEMFQRYRSIGRAKL